MAQTRFRDPTSPGSPLLEMVHYPLFSTVNLPAAAIPRSTLFFQYAIGSLIAGSGSGVITATRFHTNMETPNFLGVPKTFTVSGVRLIVNPLNMAGGTPALADAITGAAIAELTQVTDLVRITQSCAFRFFVGPKDYINAPMFTVPGNAAVGGAASSSISNTNAASVFQNYVMLQQMGMGWNLSNFPVLIANAQSFGAELLNQWATNLTLIAQKYVTVVLDGIMGREVG
jgi:hypothetical protein